MAMPVLVPRLAKTSDWPEMDEIGDELKQLFQPPKPEKTPPDPRIELAQQKGQIDLQKGQMDIQKKEMELEHTKLKGELDIQEKGLEIVKDAQQIASSENDDSEKMYEIAQKAVVDVLKRVGVV